MTVGTRSVLFGVHNIIIHPLVVGIAWWKLFGPPLDPRLWIAFLVHDIGLRRQVFGRRSNWRNAC